MTPTIFTLLSFILVLLNLADGCFTVFLLQHWLFAEANPVMSNLLLEFPRLFIPIKVILITVGMLFAARLYPNINPKHTTLCSHGLIVATLFYVATVVWEIYLVWYHAPLLF